MHQDKIATLNRKKEELIALKREERRVLQKFIDMSNVAMDEEVYTAIANMEELENIRNAFPRISDKEMFAYLCRHYLVLLYKIDALEFPLQEG